MTTTSESVVTITKPSGKKNRNGKVDIHRKNDYVYVPNAPRKLCNKCGSSSHLNHVCNITSISLNNVTSENRNLHRTLLKDRTCNFCSNIDFMPCKIVVMSICFNLNITLNQIYPYMDNI